MSIKAIETLYHGCLFRSRKEARLAVLLDYLHIRWEYEPEGYEFDNGARYLCDFLLPDDSLWVEVKGVEPTLMEFERASQLAVNKPDQAVIITWENFDHETCGNNVAFWHDKDGVFHSQKGIRWLDNAEAGWKTARSARFERGDIYKPMSWPEPLPGGVMNTELSF